MIATAYAYFNYRFSQFNFINFSDFLFYESKHDLFIPSEPYYHVIIYSSKRDDIDTLLKKLNEEYPILAIDLAQARFNLRHKYLDSYDSTFQFV